MYDTTQTRTWAEVSLDNIEHNFRELSEKISGSSTVMGIVKANGYGHGAVQIASLLQRSGCRYLAVASVDEALQLRSGGIILPILILGWTAPEETEILLDYDITQAISDLDTALKMSEIAVRSGKKLKIHLKADSGMGRLGFPCHDGEDPIEVMARVAALPGFDTEGIFTHFAVSEVVGDPYTEMQFQSFTALVKRLEQRTGIHFRCRHCANSGAVINDRRMDLDMVRPGLALYGLYPGKNDGGFRLLPALSLKTRIYQIKDFAEGYSVSYGRTYRTPGPRRIAVIPVGYADGLHRVLSNKLEVLVRGKRVKQCGNICMDMCMLDVTDVPEARTGDVVTLIGSDGGKTISADELGDKAGTISYEIFCSLSPRVQRVFTYHGCRL